MDINKLPIKKSPQDKRDDLMNRMARQAWDNSKKYLDPNGTNWMNRLETSTKGDSVSNRVQQEIDKYKESVKRAKKTGLMDMNQPVKVWNTEGGFEVL